MEVAGSDRRQPGVRHPAEELRPIEQLEGMGEPAKPGVAREPLREASPHERGLVPVRMRRDDRGAGLCGRSHGLGDPVVHRDEGSEPDGDRMSRQHGLVVVERQLEARDDEHSVRPPGARCLAFDLGEVAGPRLLAHGAEQQPFLFAPRIVGPHHVVGDAEHVEPVTSVEIDELGDGQLAVAPARMRVQLAEQRSETPSHCP